VRVRRETKGRGGKTVTVAAGIPLGEEGIRSLATELKQKLGTGGAIRGNTIEIQGDHVERILSELAGRGFTVKRAGG
jgi:translation initiation factor 1